MAGHYLKILKWLETYARRAADIDENWQQTIFEDLTHGGTRLDIVPLPSNAQGPLIGLYGKVFFCHAGQDQERRDSLFVSRIEAADRHIPATPPETVLAEYSLLTTADVAAPRLDPVVDILDRFRREVSFGGESEPRSLASLKAHRPSAELSAALAGAGARLRRLWAPKLDPASLGTEALLAAAQAAWRRFRIEKYVRPTLRQRGLLKGTVRPHVLSKRDLQLLRSAFDLSVLNAFARDPLQSKRTLLSLVERLADLPLEERLRAQIWSTMVAGASPMEVRRALAEVAEVLPHLDVAAADEWTGPLLGALKDAATRGGDDRLAALAEQAESEQTPLLVVADWASRLRFAEAEEDPSASVELMAPDLAPPKPVRPPAPVFPEPSAVPPLDLHRPAPPPAVVRAEDSPLFARWVLGLRGRSSEEFQGIADSARRALATWLPQANVQTVSGVLDFIARLRALHGEVTRWLQTLPDTMTLEADLREASEALERATKLLGEGAPKLIEEAHDLEPAELLQVARMLADRAALSRLPHWLWSEDEEEAEPVRFSAAAEPIPSAWVKGLLVPEVRTRIERATKLASELGAGADDVLTRIPRPAPGTPPGRHFEAALRRAQEMVRALDDVPAHHRDWVRQALSDGAPPSRLLVVVPKLEELKPRLSAEVFAQILERVAATPVDGLVAVVDALFEVVANIETVLGRADDATFEQITRSLTRLCAERVNRGPAYSLDADPVDNLGKPVPLLYFPPEGGEPGSVSLALALNAERLSDLEVVLAAHVEGELALPGLPVTTANLAVSRFDWRPSGAAYVHTFELRLPCLLPQGRALEAAFEARDGRTGQLLCQRKLRFPEVLEQRRPAGRLLSFDSVPFEWADRVQPDYVLAHPIGPQQQHADILGLLSRGGSFAVIAPRRFGKTTLVEFVQSKAGSLGLLVPESAVCTSFFAEDSLDDERLWTAISSRLEALLGVGLRRSWRGGLPDEDAFDDVRRVAGERGFGAVALLFDEAQLFFPAQRGHLKGNRLKDLLERHWSKRQGEMVPLVFGFVGLPSLPERAGANLMGHLTTFTGGDIGEREISRVVDRVTCGALTLTREARQCLAGQARNLFLLKTLLFRVVRQVNEARRAFAAYQDLLAAETDLRRDLEAGAEQTLAQYMRDVLNDADDVSVWEPKPCYPVAVALAAEDSAIRMPVPARVQRVIARLNEWCRPLRGQTGNALVFTEARVEAHLHTLEELGVWTARGFASPILQAWLFGLSRGFPASESDERALFRAALHRIRIPDGLEQVDAETYRFTRDGTQLILRKFELSTESRRARFLESLDALGVIRNRLLQREEGAEFVFDLEAVGIAEDEDVGVEIHPRVAGESLARKLGRLGDGMVTSLGLRLAKALRLLHAHDVLHRDLNPGSVVLADEGFRPVLVDFGLDRVLREDGPAPWRAPELWGMKPEWTPAADVYALGWTLESLLRADRPAKSYLLDVLALCKAEQPTDRPTADHLVDLFGGVERELGVLKHQQESWQRIRQTAAEDLRKFWFQRVVERFKPRFQALTLGLHDAEVDRLVELSVFLDEVLAAYPSVPQPLRLAIVRHHNATTRSQLVQLSVEIAHALKMARTQPDRGAFKERLLERFQIQSELSLRARVVEAARQIGGALHLGTLGDVVRLVLELSAPRDEA